MLLLAGWQAGGITPLAFTAGGGLEAAQTTDILIPKESRGLLWVRLS